MENKGITLVSLVVTIIVLMILAGVSINLTLGEGGIITIAKHAKENMELAQREEATKLNELYAQMEAEGILGELDYDVIAKLNHFKKAIADYIEEAGGIKPEYTANVETFGESIKGIVKEVTKNATATEADITEGKTAWVNGNLITGTANNLYGGEKNCLIVRCEFTNTYTYYGENTSFSTILPHCMRSNFNINDYEISGTYHISNAQGVQTLEWAFDGYNEETGVLTYHSTYHSSSLYLYAGSYVNVIIYPKDSLVVRSNFTKEYTHYGEKTTFTTILPENMRNQFHISDYEISGTCNIKNGYGSHELRWELDEYDSKTGTLTYHSIYQSSSIYLAQGSYIDVVIYPIEKGLSKAK